MQSARLGKPSAEETNSSGKPCAEEPDTPGKTEVVEEDRSRQLQRLLDEPVNLPSVEDPCSSGKTEVLRRFQFRSPVRKTEAPLDIKRSISDASTAADSDSFIAADSERSLQCMR